MRKEVILGLIILSVITAACATQQPSVRCDAPYKIVSEKCCLDDNNNNLCDDEESKEKIDQKACKTDGDCELDLCVGCVSKAWIKENPVRAMCDRAEFSGMSCKCVQNACAEVPNAVETKIEAGGKIRFGEEKLPISLEMQKDTKILFVTATGDEIYTLDTVQETQIIIFYENERFTIKKGTHQTIGPLDVIFSGVNPPKSGNYAMIKVDRPSA